MLTLVVLAAMIAAASHASGQTRPPGDGGSKAPPAALEAGPAAGSPAGPRDTYRSRVHDEMAAWRRKMRDFDETAETRGRHHLDAVETRLRTAWDETEVEARNVETATDRDWDRTRRAYERATHRMAVAWDKARL